jgi:hypothetical protein
MLRSQVKGATMDTNDCCLLGLDRVNCIGCYFMADKCQYPAFLVLSHDGLPLGDILKRLGLHRGNGENGLPPDTLEAPGNEAPAQ